MTTRGNRRQSIFLGDGDYERFLDLLAEVARRYGWRIHAYCLMPNHYHLVAETPEGTLSDGMERLNGRYAQWFNLRHGYEGHVFERRFHSRLVESLAHLMELARYLPLNPVRARLCTTAAGWRWSSYRAAIGKAPRPRFLAPGRVLGLFGKGARARRAFEEFVLSGTLQPRPP